jgi:ribosomal protein L3 glutamine methyltransferase
MQNSPMNHPFTTLRDLLRYAVSRFNEAQLSFGHGTANAYDEAAYLLLHTLHLPIDTLEPFLDATLLESEREAVMAVIKRRANDRLPAAYITGEAWMQGYRFTVDERVIVPRSLIGEVLHDRLSPWIAEPETVGAVLELCTGSGCLAILAADAFPNCEVDAVDISTDALEVAHLNVTNYTLDDRIALYHGDLYEPLGEPEGVRRYDLIISNPPYVNAASMQTLPAEYLHEPRLALAGGADGMDLVRRIIADARRWLTGDGILLIEIGNEQEHVEAVFGSLDISWVTTSAGDDAVFLIQARDLPE